jgi:hypothetical protein
MTFLSGKIHRRNILAGDRCIHHIGWRQMVRIPQISPSPLRHDPSLLFHPYALISGMLNDLFMRSGNASDDAFGIPDSWPGSVFHTQITPFIL